MITQYAQYDNTGRITAILSCSDELTDDDLIKLNKKIDGNDYYVNLKTKKLNKKKKAKIKKNKTKIIADGSDAIVISNIPKGASYILHDGSTVLDGGTVSDGNLEISIDESGKYTVEINHLQHFEVKIDFEATDKN